MEQLIRDQRVRIDAIGLTIHPRIDSRELSLTYTALQLASMWLGVTLGVLGSANPYPKSDDPNSGVIEDRTDQAPSPLTLMRGRVAGVKQLRAIIKEIQTALSGDIAGHATCAHQYLQEARMWLGMELNSVKLKEDALVQREEAFEHFKMEQARAAYNRYGQTTNFKNFLGDAIPQFDDLSETIRNAWAAAISTYLSKDNPQGGAHPPKPDLWES